MPQGKCFLRKGKKCHTDREREKKGEKQQCKHQSWRRKRRRCSRCQSKYFAVAHGGPCVGAVGYLLKEVCVTCGRARTLKQVYPEGLHPMESPCWSSSQRTVAHGQSHGEAGLKYKKEGATRRITIPDLLQHLWRGRELGMED